MTTAIYVGKKQTKFLNFCAFEKEHDNSEELNQFSENEATIKTTMLESRQRLFVGILWKETNDTMIIHIIIRRRHTLCIRTITNKINCYSRSIEVAFTIHMFCVWSHKSPVEKEADKYCVCFIIFRIFLFVWLPFCLYSKFINFVFFSSLAFFLTFIWLQCLSHISCIFWNTIVKFAFSPFVRSRLPNRRHRKNTRSNSFYVAAVWRGQK